MCAPTTTPRDKKQLLRTVLEEVMVSAPRGEFRIHLTLRPDQGLVPEVVVAGDERVPLPALGVPPSTVRRRIGRTLSRVSGGGSSGASAGVGFQF